MDLLQSLLHMEDRPFQAVPNLRYYYPAQSVETARTVTVRAVRRAEGPVLIVGRAGVGKSMLCKMVAVDVREQFDPVLLFGPAVNSRHALLQAIMHELQLPYAGASEGELRLRLLDRLAPSGEYAPDGLCLVIDDADQLSLQVLEELRLMTNLCRDNRPRIRLVLSGGPQLEEVCAAPELESFNQRLAARCYLSPMTRQETIDYVCHQFNVAGIRPETVVSPDALEAIFTGSDGIPRLVNQLMDHALVLAAEQGKVPVTGALVEEAWADLQQLPPPWSTSSHGPTRDIRETSSSTETSIEFGELSDDDDVAVAAPDESAPVTVDTRVCSESSVPMQSGQQEPEGKVDVDVDVIVRHVNSEPDVPVASTNQDTRNLDQGVAEPPVADVAACGSEPSNDIELVAGQVFVDGRGDHENVASSVSAIGDAPPDEGFNTVTNLAASASDNGIDGESNANNVKINNADNAEGFTEVDTTALFGTDFDEEFEIPLVAPAKTSDQPADLASACLDEIEVVTDKPVRESPTDAGRAEKSDWSASSSRGMGAADRTAQVVPPEFPVATDSPFADSDQTTAEAGCENVVPPAATNVETDPAGAIRSDSIDPVHLFETSEVGSDTFEISALGNDEQVITRVFDPSSLPVVDHNRKEPERCVVPPINSFDVWPFFQPVAHPTVFLTGSPNADPVATKAQDMPAAPSASGPQAMIDAEVNPLESETEAVDLGKELQLQSEIEDLVAQLNFSALAVEGIDAAPHRQWINGDPAPVNSSDDAAYRRPQQRVGSGVIDEVAFQPIGPPGSIQQTKVPASGVVFPEGFAMETDTGSSAEKPLYAQLFSRLRP